MTYSEQVFLFIGDAILREGMKIEINRYLYFIQPYCNPNVKLLKVKRYMKGITANHNILVDSEQHDRGFSPLLVYTCTYASNGSSFLHRPACTEVSQCVICPFLGVGT